MQVCFFCTRWLYPVVCMANYSSVWIVIVICLHRYFAICYRSMGRQKSMRYLRKNAFIVSVILFFSVAINFARFWEYRLNKYGIITTGIFSLHF